MPTKTNRVLRKIQAGGVFVAQTATVLVMTYFFGLAIMQFGPNLEGRLNPVLTNMSFRQMGVYNDEVVFEVSGIKKRSCQFVSIDVLALNSNGWEKAAFHSSAPKSPGNPGNRPTGPQSFGSWYVKPTGSHLRFTATYDCHDGFNTVTELGTVEVIRASS